MRTVEKIRVGDKTYPVENFIVEKARMGFKFGDDGMVPVAQIIAELHAANESYLVDVKLFSLVNRTLNEHGYRANVQSNDGMHLEFRIENKAQT